MASTLLSQFLVGTTFGASLLLSGVADPATITSQFALKDFHMLIAFLSASSASALIVYLSNTSDYAKLPPRSCSDYGWLGRYGGNIVGGTMQGVAMAISGACPGTVLVQTVMGWGKGPLVMLGGVIGGALFLIIGERLRIARSASKEKAVPEIKTFQEKLGVSTEQMLVVYELAMVSIISSASMFAPMSAPWRNALLGGCMIGAAQACSVLLSRKTLGVSTAFQDVSGHILRRIDRARAKPGWGSIVFAAGVMAGAKIVALSQAMPVLITSTTGISSTAAFTGGVLSIFGARMAGGCTSGHGISGCSTLSVSSLITVASMFGGGIAFRLLLAE